MADGLKSFKRDWDRWSVSERVFAVFFVAASMAALVGSAVAGV